MSARGEYSFLRHTAMYFVARGLPGIVAFLQIPLFSYLLDAGGYGRYGLALATVGLLNAVLFQWLHLGVVRFVPACRDDLGALKSTLLTAWLVLSGALAVLTFIACLLPVMRPWRLLAAACWALACLQGAFELCGEYSRSRVQPWRYMVLQLARAILSTGAGAALIVMGLGAWGPLGGLAIGMVLPLAWAWRSDWPDARLRPDRPSLANLLQYGVPLSITVALAVVIGSSSRFIIAALMGEEAAGLYSVAVDFTSRTLVLLLVVVQTAMFPLAVRAWEEQGPEAARAQMRHNAGLVAAVGVPAVAALAVLSANISRCFFGPEFREAATQIMPLMALAAFLGGFKACHCDAAFQFARRTLHQVWIVAIVAVLSILLTVLLTMTHGLVGAAGASVAAYALAIVLTVAVGRRYFAVPFPMVAFGQVAVATAAMAAVLWPLRDYRGGVALAVQVACGLAVYALGLAAMDFMGLRRALSRGSGEGSGFRVQGSVGSCELRVVSCENPQLATHNSQLSLATGNSPSPLIGD